MQYSIVIVNWNGKEHLEECLDSLYKQTFKDFEIIIVDNGSTDGSKEFIRKNYPKVKLTENSKNMGFEKPNNQGINIAKGDYILTLNNDIRADKNFLKELLTASKKYPDAFFSCKMLFYSNPSKVNSKGLKLYYDAKAEDIDFNKEDVKNEEIKEVFGACGGAALFPRKLIDDISFEDFFDEDFFLYCEDLDISLRARLRGWKCYYVPKAVVYHKHNATAKKVPDIALYHYTKNKLFVIIKNYPLIFILKYSFIILLRQIVSSIYYLFRFNFTPIKARFAVLYYLPKMIRKRLKIQETRKISNNEFNKWILPRPILKSLFSN